jgi:hypothetical protein
MCIMSFIKPDHSCACDLFMEIIPSLYVSIYINKMYCLLHKRKSVWTPRWVHKRSPFASREGVLDVVAPAWMRIETLVTRSSAPRNYSIRTHAPRCNHLGPFAPLVRVCFGDKWQPYACDQPLFCSRFHIGLLSQVFNEMRPLNLNSRTKNGWILQG